MVGMPARRRVAPQDHRPHHADCDKTCCRVTRPRMRPISACTLATAVRCVRNDYCLLQAGKVTFKRPGLSGTTYPCYHPKLRMRQDVDARAAPTESYQSAEWACSRCCRP